MLKTLIISREFKFVKRLINTLDIEDLGICICGISDSLHQTNPIVNHRKIDIMLIDTEMQLFFSKTFLKKHGYKIIYISMDDLSPKNIENVIQKISNLTINANLSRKQTKIDLILDELKYLGYKIKYKGVPLLASAILEVFEHPEYGFNNFEHRIFPIVAKVHHTSVSNVKSSINNATIYMYRDCNIEKLKEYFGFYEDIKPSVKTVALEVYNRVNSKL